MIEHMSIASTITNVNLDLSENRKKNMSNKHTL